MSSAAKGVSQLSARLESAPDTMVDTTPIDSAAVPTPQREQSPERAVVHDELPFSRKMVVMAFVALTQLVQMIPFGGGLATSIHIAQSLGEPSVASAAWVAAAYPLTQGAFILPGGRLGAVYGHKNTLFLGAFLWVAFTIGTGFAPNFVVLCVLRALTGIGGGIMVPNCIALLGITFPPGFWRNIAMALFVSGAPVGAAGGGVLAGLVAQLASWRWMFWFFAILGFVVFTTAAISVPHDAPQDPNGKIDIVGSYFGVGALFLFNFVWNQAPAVGWNTVYIYVLLIVSILHGVAFGIWEAKFAKEPIVPVTVWKRPSFTPLILSVFLIMMSFGIFLWYIEVWELTVRNYSIIAAGASISPIVFTGSIMSVLAGWLIQRLPAEYIICIGIAEVTAALVILGTMPTHQVYWAQAFVASAVIGAGPDFVLTAGQVITSNAVSRQEQGVAGALIGVVQVYGLATGLGFAGTVERYTNDGGRNPVKGFRGAIFLGVGFCVLALAINLLFVRMPADKREGWAEEDLQRRDTEVEKKGPEAA